MKNRLSQFPKVKPSFFRLQWLWMIALLLVAGVVQAQDEEEDDGRDLRPVRSTFQSIWLIDNQTVMVPVKGTFQFDIIHRFGPMSNGYSDFFGLYAPSNIRLGFEYVPFERFMVGFGFTKENLYWDFNARYAILRQARKGGSPVSITYFGNIALDTRAQSSFPEDTYEGIDRISYFNQLMIARKFSRAFSLQASFNLSHFNFQELKQDPEDPNITRKLNNTHLSLTFLGRLMISPTTSIIANYDLPLTNHDVLDVNQPKPNLAFGIEFTSSSHAFQIFVSNYYSIVPQRNNVFNLNEWSDGVLLGFNITRLWNF